MKFTHSIRWRILLWNGLLWIIILTLFGMAAWRTEHDALLRQLDREIEARHSVIEAAIRIETEKKGGNPPPPPDPTDLSAYEQGLFDGEPENVFYYVIWRGDGVEVARSASAPPNVPKPERIVGEVNSRTRENFRERYWFTPRGEVSLTGHSMKQLETASDVMVGKLMLVGGTVLLIGLSVGWWISTRSLRPIADISDTATKIADGDLSQRISTSEYESELGRLAALLNAMFERLSDAFEQQSRFVADAAHELRTPITVVLTHAQNGLMDSCTESERIESITAIERAAQRMKRLVEALLQLARLDAEHESLQFKSLDLSDIADEAFHHLNVLANSKHIRMITELKPAPCAGDPALLEQVTTNLIANAIDYNYPGGYVRVQTFTEDAHACLSVTNSGPGIAEKDMPHLFERFYRVEKARTTGHAGLGLSIAKSIMEKHGGDIAVTSQLDGDTYCHNIQLDLPYSTPKRANYLAG